MYNIQNKGKKIVKVGEKNKISPDSFSEESNSYKKKTLSSLNFLSL